MRRIFELLIIIIFVVIGCGKKHTNPSQYIHTFYYPWYGNQEFDNEYFHWSHSVLGDVDIPHTFPGGDDIGANYFPQLGCYSSNDSKVIDIHMQQIIQSGIGTICLSWWGIDSFENRAVKLILEKAEEYNIYVNFHLEPFPERNAKTMYNAIQYIIDEYGNSPAFYRDSSRENRPLFYVYDSYLSDIDEWKKLLLPTGEYSIRNTSYDSDLIGLWVSNKEEEFFFMSGFDGFYTYFAVDGFTFGSTCENWEYLAKWAEDNNKIFIPCVGPGYIDTRIRPWNSVNIRERNKGKYYARVFNNAIRTNPYIIGITSFNEWHEGTQIEPAVLKHIEGYEYENYHPLEPDAYLFQTNELSKKYINERNHK